MTTQRPSDLLEEIRHFIGQLIYLGKDEEVIDAVRTRAQQLWYQIHKYEHENGKMTFRGKAKKKAKK